MKINFLILGLVLVFVLMNRLETKGLGPSLLTVMGLGSDPAKQVSWCDTRVTALETTGVKLLQEGLKWFVETGTKTEVDFVSVEKSLGSYTVAKNSYGKI